MTQSNSIENELPEWKYGGVRLQMSSVPEDEKQVDYKSPSTVDGLTTQEEYDLRIAGCELIQLSGQLLKLPQVAMATGQVLFQRFFHTKSLIRHDYEHYAMGCIHLAAKIEECPRRLRDTINVFHHMRQTREQKPFKPLVPDQAYVNIKNQVIKSERRVLKELGFCVHVKHPHKLIICFLQFLGEEKNSHLVQCAWNFMNDSLRTSVFVCYHPETIACACIYLAARQLKIPMPESQNLCWWDVFLVKESSIQSICFEILRLYSRDKPKITHLESRLSQLHEQRRVQLEKRQRQREVANAQASDGTTIPNGNGEIGRNQYLRYIPGTLLTASNVNQTESKSDANRQRNRNRSSSSDERSYRQSKEKTQKYRSKKGRDRRKFASRSRTPKAYRTVVNHSRSRSRSRRRSSRDKHRRRNRKRSYSSSSRSLSSERHYHRKHRAVPRRRRLSRSLTKSVSPALYSSAKSSRKSGHRYSVFSTLNGRSKDRRN